MSVPGVTSVPAMCWLSTSMAMTSSRVGIVDFDRVLCERPRVIVDAVEVDERVGWYGMGRVIDLAGRAADAHACRIALKSLEGQNLCAAGAADAPGLLEHAGASLSGAVHADGDVVVPAGGEQTVVGLQCGPVIAACERDCLPRIIVERVLAQRVEATARDVQRGTAVDLVATVVDGRLLGAAIGSR